MNSDRYEWAKLDEYPDYDFRSDGTIWNRYTERRVSMSPTGSGGYKVNLRIDGRNQIRSPAKVICQAFHGEPLNDQVVAYKDGDPSNLNYTNLFWASRSQANDLREQLRRGGRPMRNMRIERLVDGTIYENSLEAANAVNGIEKYIYIAAADPMNTFYKGSRWRWVRD